MIMAESAQSILQKLENFPVGTIVFDTNRKFVGVNPKLRILFGLTAETKLPDLNSIFVHVTRINGLTKSDAQFSLENLDHFRSEKGRCEFNLHFPDGTESFLKCELLVTEDGHILSFSDISAEVIAQKKLQHKNRLQELMFQILKGNLAARTKESDTQMHDSLHAIADYLDADHVCIYAYSPDLSSQRLAYEWHTAEYNDCCTEVNDSYFCSKEHIVEAHKAGKVWTTRNATCPIYCAKDCGKKKGTEMTSWFSVPIMREGKCYGYLNCKHLTKEHHYTDDEIQLLTVFAELTCNLVDSGKSIDQIRLESLTNSATHYIIRVDANGYHTYWNKKFQEDYGWIYGNLEMAQSNALGSICEYDREKTVKVVTECMMNPGKIVQVELDKPGKNGDIRTTLWEFVALTDESGIPTELQCMGMDITESVNLRKNLEANEQKYRTLSESSDNAILLIDISGVILYANPAAARYYGMTQEEAVGKNSFEIFQGGNISEVQELIHFISTEKRSVKKETELKFPTGSYWFLNTVTPLLNENGDVSTIMINAQDITEIKNFNTRLENSEKRYRTLFYDSGIPYLILVDNKFVDFNAAALELTGMTPDELRNSDPFILSPEFQPNGMRTFDYSVQEFEKCMRDPKHAFECVHQRKDGTPFIALASVKPVKYGDVDGLFVIWRDITELKQAEFELELKERRLRELAEFSKTVIWETDKAGLITYISNTTSQVLGYSPDQIIGKVTLYDLYDVKMAHQRKESDVAVFSMTSGMSQYDAKLRHKDNKSVWVNRTVTPILNPDGVCIGYRGSDTDISERKAAEELFKQFKIISDQSNHGTTMTTVDGLVIYTNDAFARMHGYTPEELEGKHLSIFHNESQLPRVGELVEIIKSKGGFEAEVVDHARKDGSTFPTLMSAKLIHDEDGNPSFLSATLIDITDRMLAEQEVRKLTVAVEQSPVPTIITDVNGNFTYANPAFVTTTGFERHEIYGKSTRILKSGQTPHEVYVEMWKKIKSGQVWSGEILNRKKNKELYWELLTISPIFDTNGSIVNYLAIKQDVTDRKKTEQEIRELNSSLEQKVQERTQELWTSNKELIEAKEMAEKANLAKSDFLSRMSHELRTPMNSILGFGQLLEMSQLDDRQRKNVKQILSSGNHLLGLINEVLDIARIESGHQTLSVEPLEVNAVLSDCIDILRPSADKRNIVVKFNHTKGASAYINADLQRTKQILLNLLNNSLKYNVEGGTVEVGYESVEGSDNKFTRIYVSDSGIGINPEYLEKIFEPFERVGAEKGSIEGTGLGLAVVKQLVTLMNGKVGVTSESGKGSKFWIDLPTVSIVTKADKDSATDTHLKSGLHKSQGKVLYVEDNPANIELIDQIVSSQRPNINLITDSTGLNVVQKAEVYTPDLILLDLNLPEIHGSEIVKQLKGTAATAHIPIVVLSADALPAQIKNLKTLGAADYMTKPIQVSHLLQVLDQYCKHNLNN